MHLSSLAVLFALVGFTFSTPARATPAEVQAYASSSYDYCDVKILSAYWSNDMGETKARIGRKIGWGDQVILDQMIGEARTQARTQGTRCSYHEAGYTYEDAALLAGVWGIDTSTAKVWIEDKVNGGNEDNLKASLEHARANAASTGGSSTGSNEAAALQAYSDSRYCYCDARVLGVHWGIDTWQSKLTIGGKLGSGGRQVVEANLAQARTAAVGRGETCSLYETNFTLADAEALATIWGISLDDSKAYIGKLTMAGRAPEARAALRTGGQPKGKGKGKGKGNKAG